MRSRLDALDYETALAAASSERGFGPRSPDDLYILYTGGTTGMPKGVMWRHEDVFFGAMGGAGGGGRPITTPEEIAERCREPRTRCVPACPFMHGTAHWMAFSALFTGGTVVIPAEHRLDALKLWQLVEQEQANFMVIVGDAFARPMLDALESDAEGRGARRLRYAWYCSPAGRSSRPRSSRARRTPARCPSLSSTATARRRRAARASRWWCRGATSRARRSSACPTTPWCSAKISSRPRVGRHRAARAARPDPARLLQGSGEDRGDLPRCRRCALGGARRSRGGRRRRDSSPCSGAARSRSTAAAKRSTPRRSSPC